MSQIRIRETPLNPQDLSWQTAYPHIMDPDFLQNRLEANRLHVWAEKLRHPPPNQWLCVAEDPQRLLLGFVCVYGKYDAKWGALVDNLHVLPDLKRSGIGKRLMAEAARWVLEHCDDGKGMYLWVLERNEAARHFYDSLGGENVETSQHRLVDGRIANVFRYSWRNPSLLIENTPGINLSASL